MHRARTLTMAATAALALTTAPALAGGPPIAMPIDRNAPLTMFTLAGPADFQDLKIDAKAGQDLFVGLSAERGFHADLFDPDGGPVGGFDSAEGGDGADDAGRELHALSSGAYTMRVTATAAADPAFLDAWAWAWGDCRGGPATRCTVTAGDTKRGTFGGAYDGDAFRILAPAGRRYAATLDITDVYRADLELVDARGRVLAEQVTGRSAPRRLHAGIRFALPRSGGPFYLKAVEDGLVGHGGRGGFVMTMTRD